MPGLGADSDRRSVRAVLVTHRTATFLGIAFVVAWLGEPGGDRVCDD